MGNDLIAKRNDELVLLYINHALQNLSAASEKLKYFGVSNTTEDFDLINNAIIDDDWNYYLNNSAVLNAQDIIAVKVWLKNIRTIIMFINQPATTDIHKLPDMINGLVNDTTLKAVREKLLNAVNQKRSQQHE